MQKPQETQVQSLGREDPLEEEMATTPVFLPGESHGQRSLVGYIPWGPKESDTTECLSPHAPERMKWLGQSGNNTQLWMCLGVKLKSDAVKDNNNSLFNNIFSLKKLKYITV